MSRIRHTHEEKAHIIREFEHPDGSTADFCRQHEISTQTFTNWRRQVQASLVSIDEPPKFLQFELGATHDQLPSSGPLVELELGSGMVLRNFATHL